MGVVGAVGGVVPVGIVTIGALEDVLPPPPQDESNAHAASALNRVSFTYPPPKKRNYRIISLQIR